MLSLYDILKKKKFKKPNIIKLGTKYCPQCCIKRLVIKYGKLKCTPCLNRDIQIKRKLKKAWLKMEKELNLVKFLDLTLSEDDNLIEQNLVTQKAIIDSRNGVNFDSFKSINDMIEEDNIKPWNDSNFR